MMTHNINICGAQLVNQVVKSLDDNPGSTVLCSLTSVSCGRGTSSTAGSGDVRAADGDAEDRITQSAGGEGDLLGRDSGEAGRVYKSVVVVAEVLDCPSLASSSLLRWRREAF